MIAESYERIHRSNLIGMGVLPLQFPEGENADSLGLTGEETYTFTGIEELNEGRTPKTVTVQADDTSSTPCCGSTPRGRPTTTATAASCSTCCVAC